MVSVIQKRHVMNKGPQKSMTIQMSEWVFNVPLIATVQLRWFFKILPPPRTGGVDFLAHRGSSLYPTPIPTSTDFLSTAFPPSSLRKTTHLPVELRGGQKFIMASSQWKISDVRMIDSSEFFRVCMGRKSEPLFCLRIILLICCWINTEIFLPRDKKQKQKKTKQKELMNKIRNKK